MPLYTILHQVRESIQVKDGRNAFTEMRITFQPIIRSDFREPWMLNSHTPEEALAVAKAALANSPLRYSLAVEPVYANL